MSKYKICTYCSSEAEESDGELTEEGEFVCAACADKGWTDEDYTCPECDEESDEYHEQGVCPSCGYERAKQTEEEEVD